MMMQILRAGGMDVLADDVRRSDASNPRGYFEYEPVKALARSSDWISEAEGKAVKVIAQLVPQLPDGHDYAILFMKRDIDEVLASQAAMLERMALPGGDPALLRRVFERQWEAAKVYAEAQPNMRVLVVDHRDVLEDPARAAREVADFLEVDLDVSAAATVVDPSLHRVRK